MQKPKTTWGTVLFCSALCLMALVFYMSAAFPASAEFYRETLPITGIVLSVILVLTGYFSYSRVHNLKVFLTGFLNGLTGLAWFLLYNNQTSIEQTPAAFFVIIFTNISMAVLVPSGGKYRDVRRITFSIFGAEACLIAAMRFIPVAGAWADSIFSGWLFENAVWIGSVWCAGLVLFTVWRMKHEFHLGGILSGACIIYCFAWAGNVISNDVEAFRSLCFNAVLLFFNAGIIVHWFLCIEHRVSYDPLLHIYNRNYCSRIISEQSKHNTSPPMAIAMIDIDHFKNVNDTYGHQAGDIVLYNIAQIIVKNTAPHGIVCRYGGEEIIAFFSGKTTKDIVDVMENVRSAVEKQKIQAGKKKIGVTVSCGVSCREEAAQEVMDVISAADKALYKAKEEGRNQVRSGKSASKQSRKK